MQNYTKNKKKAHDFVLRLMGICLGIISAILLLLLGTNYSQLFLIAFCFVICIILYAIIYYIASILIGEIIGELAKGMMMGMNAAMNIGMLFILTDMLIIAIIMGVIPLFAASFSISRNMYYLRIISWLNWLLPMSWLVLIPGLIFLLINIIVGLFSSVHKSFHFLKTQITTYPAWGMCSVRGGLIYPLRGYSGFNMGCVIFMKFHTPSLLRHEMGHSFSLAVFGAIFHYVGAIDENYIQADPTEAYAEYIADSYDKPSDSLLSMWA